MTLDQQPETRRGASGVQMEVPPFFQPYATVFVSLVPIVIVVLRVARVSNFETTTARGVLESLSLVQIVAGTLLPLVPTVLFVSALALSVYAFRERTPLARASRVVAPLVALFCIALFPWGILALLVAVTLVVVAIEWGIARHRSTRFLASFNLNWFLAVGVLLIVGQLFVYGTMWLPADRIHRRGGATTVGYVLDSGIVWTTVLVDSNRTIRRVPTDSIQRRVVCQLKDSDIDGEESLLDLMLNRRRQPYPEC
ncbi:MAG TPA: hypothetical protein VFH36_15760 [Acidimicrobiales bacterium]|nr:hypothetical protein [Acidimicrobiales bacterium]